MSSIDVSPKAAPTWPGRVWRFTAQMFPLYPNVLLLAAQFVLSYLIVARFFVVRAESIVVLELVCGSATNVLFLYLLRVCDEIKDYETDATNFPTRPLVTGVMSLKDARRLVVATLAALCLLQLPFLGRAVLWVFAVAIVYSLLAFKWFFCERAIRNSLPLALMTHNPITYVYQLYLLSFFWAPTQAWPLAALVYLLGDGLTGTAWEIARKIRGRSEEDGYTTYSKIWGPVRPVVLVAALLAGTWLATAWAFASVPTGRPLLWLWILPLAVWILFVIAAGRFFRNSQRAPRFRQLVEGFKVAMFICLIAALVLARSES